MMPNLSLVWDEENSEKQTNENAPNKKHKIQKLDMQPLIQSFKTVFYLLTCYGTKINQTSKEPAPSEPNTHIYNCCQVENEHL